MRVKVERCDEVPETLQAFVVQTDEHGTLVLNDEYGRAIAWYGSGAWTKVSFDYSDEIEDEA